MHSTMNCGRSYYIIRHLTANLLPHYLAKCECSTVQLYTIVIQFKSVTNRSFTVNICVKFYVLDYISVPINLRYYSMCSKCSPSARTRVLRRARHFVNECVSDALLLQCCAKRVAGTVAIYCIDMV